MADFWIPQSNHEILKILIAKWPDSATRFRCMKRKQLLAVFCNLRKQQLKGNDNAPSSN